MSPLVTSRLWQAAPMHDERHLALIGSDRRRLVRAATRLLGAADAEDAVQDAYVRALEANTLQLNAAQAWLLTVVRNLAFDRLRRRRWMQEWLGRVASDDTAQLSPSAEMDAALAQDAARALRHLAATLTPAEGAAVLLHEVFEADHAELARASGRSDGGSRQQLRRALLRLRRSRRAPERDAPTERDPGQEFVAGLYLQSLRLRDPQTLWALLRQPQDTALTPLTPLTALTAVAAETASAPDTTACSVVQLDGQLGLVLTLDGVTLCVLPLGMQCTQPDFALGRAVSAG